jgi:hypothetical protein
MPLGRLRIDRDSGRQYGVKKCERKGQKGGLMRQGTEKSSVFFVDKI